MTLRSMNDGQMSMEAGDLIGKLELLQNFCDMFVLFTGDVPIIDPGLQLLCPNFRPPPI
jgi:hypothetical protein